MTEQEYYKTVFSKLENCFKWAPYVLGFGTELVKLGWNPNGLLATVEPKEKLWELTCNYGMQVFLPLIGINSSSVLAPLDFEISLTSENSKLYDDKEYQKYFFKKIFILINYLEKLFRDKKINFLLDLTPSGGHILFYVKRNTKAFDEFRNIGFLEPNLKIAYNYKSSDDIQRKNGVSEDAGFVFSGIGRLSEYIGLKASIELKECGGFKITMCDSLDKSINYDNSWAGDPCYKRIIRSPLSLHKKNTQKYGKYWQNSLVDVLKSVYDTNIQLKCDDINYLIDCMWDLNLASKHFQSFSGFIPVVNDNICSLIDEYKKSELYKFHKNFDNSEDYPKGEIFQKAINDTRLNDETKNILKYPDPSLLQPMRIKNFIRNLVIDNGYKPKEAACLIRDFYQDSKYHWGGINWLKYPSVTRAFFWTRMYCSVLYIETGQMKL